MNCNESEREIYIFWKKIEREGIKDEQGGMRKGREEWTPVTLHANLTQPGCATTTGGGGNENEEKKKKGKGKKCKRMERNCRASRMTIYELSQ